MNNINKLVLELKNKPFIKAIINEGGEIYVVGGLVRDLVLNKPNKDIDLVVRLIAIDRLISILNNFGKVDVVGKSFGVIKFFPFDENVDYDISLPRTEFATGDGGHKDFDVSFDENLSIEKDLVRRDAKINSMAINLNTEQFIDPFQGLKDIEKKQMSMTNPEAFSDDPLRMLRMIGFASRFDFDIEPETMREIKNNAHTIRKIPAERILTEFDKIVKKGDAFKGAFLLKDSGLMRQIFGIDGGLLASSVWGGVKTMGEFIYLLSHNLVDDPATFYKRNLKGDTPTFKEIQAFTLLEEVRDDRRLNRGLVHQILKLAPQVLQSALVPNELKPAIQDLMSGQYPKNVKDLAISGNDLVSLNVPPQQRGVAYSTILSYIYADKLRNNREELLNFVENKVLNKQK